MSLREALKCHGIVEIAADEIGVIQIGIALGKLPDIRCLSENAGDHIGKVNQGTQKAAKVAAVDTAQFFGDVKVIRYSMVSWVE